MAINISIINLVKDVTEDTREEVAVEKLRSSLEQEFNNFPNGSGQIVLLTNVLFGGGSVGELDIVLLCDLKNVSFSLYDPKDHINKEIIVERLCYVLEVKDHDSRGVCIRNNGYNVKYDGVWHPVSSQSRKQRFEFKKYLTKNLMYIILKILLQNKPKQAVFLYLFLNVPLFFSRSFTLFYCHQDLFQLTRRVS